MGRCGRCHHRAVDLRQKVRGGKNQLGALSCEFPGNRRPIYDADLAAEREEVAENIRTPAATADQCDPSHLASLKTVACPVHLSASGMRAE